MKRRELLQTAIATGAVAAIPIQAEENSRFEIVDTNISLFHWPFRRLPLDETDRILKKMRDLGITKAFAGSFEGILMRDISSVNTRLAEECAKHPGLIPIGSINPVLPGWDDDLKRCVDDHGMRGIRLHPNYHGYTLDGSRLLKLLKLAFEAGIFVQLAAVFEDVRTQPDALRIADVDLTPLVENHGGTAIQILNWRPGGDLLEKLAAIPTIHFDIARIDQTDGVASLLNSVPKNRVLFGTHAPFLIPEASLIRVHESGLDDFTLRSILQSNAENLLKG